MGRAPFVAQEVGPGILSAYADLVETEARLCEALAPQDVRFRSSLVDAWSTLHDYLHIYARHLSPAGVVVFGGGPDAASARTGIPFTGPGTARERLGLGAQGDARSPSEDAFWDAVALAAPASGGASVESLFGTVHLAHARPFDVEATREVRDASARHTLRILEETRPQAAVAVGTEALHVLARALGDARVLDVAAIPEDVWCRQWPAGTRMLQYPYVEVPAARPFRMRLVPVPALDGPLAAEGAQALASVLAYAWAA